MSINKNDICKTYKNNILSEQEKEILVQCINEIKKVMYKEYNANIINKYINKNTLEHFSCAVLLDCITINNQDLIKNNIRFKSFLRLNLMYLIHYHEQYMQNILEQHFADIHKIIIIDCQDNFIKNMVSKTNYFFIENNLEEFILVLLQLFAYTIFILKVDVIADININNSIDLIELFILLSNNEEIREYLNYILYKVNDKLINKNIESTVRLTILEKFFQDRELLQFDEDDGCIWEYTIVEYNDAFSEEFQRKTIDQKIEEYLVDINQNI